uniref:Uncharacterized protein n=1 Tax=Cacopsylla melanoneura TaxID=428564 RepID=A0A8D8UNJ8_9HEMI
MIWLQLSTVFSMSSLTSGMVCIMFTFFRMFFVASLVLVSEKSCFSLSEMCSSEVLMASLFKRVSKSFIALSLASMAGLLLSEGASIWVSTSLLSPSSSDVIPSSSSSSS